MAASCSKRWRNSLFAATPPVTNKVATLQACAAARVFATKSLTSARWNEAINVVNLTAIGELIARSALTREESRGAHYRTDFPIQDPRWMKNIRVKQSPGGQPAFSFGAVEFTRLASPEPVGAKP